MNDKRKQKIVLFSGGSACRSLNFELCRHAVDITRIVPSWDSGGSSKAIRERLGILAVGDLRQALMTMAHGEGRVGDIVKICNARLSAGVDPATARAEFDYYADAKHPLLARSEPGLRGAILSYLKVFRAEVGDDFDFRNGSIGNFILTGAYLAHSHDINTAVFVFRKICGIEGDVWPATTQNGVELSALLGSGKHLAQQHLITTMAQENAQAGISGIELKAPDQNAVANDAALEAIQMADAIVFGPGSFYSSILPHLLVDGVVAAIRSNAHATKFLIGNILECSETMNSDLATLTDVFATTWKQHGGGDIAPLDHVIANRELFPFPRTIGATPYLANGDLEATCHRLGIKIEYGEFEDAWQRGTHDGKAIVSSILQSLPDGL